ncbi:MAG: ABC transporter ATP-binding protein [Spirochaetes bacterium]|jgi:NitT/TauT family transport system ATP-binding protein|nr:ABC transporter ATP-binding protein [Spirochaetota bacterium]
MISIYNLSKTYHLKNENKNVDVYKNFSIELPTEKITCFIGGNGCGKTSLFYLIAGLLDKDSGTILINNKKPEETGIGFVFQDYKRSLFPWLTVLDNICLPLEQQGIKKKYAREQTRNFIEDMGFEFLSSYLDLYPYHLSGGMAQSAALIRGLIHSPDLLLMDEPLGALDLNYRFFMEDKILELQKRTKVSILLISHDVEEAVYLGDLCLLMSNKPATITNRMEVSFPYTRTQKIKHNSEFINYKKILFTDFQNSRLPIDHQITSSATTCGTY